MNDGMVVKCNRRQNYKKDIPRSKKHEVLTRP